MSYPVHHVFAGDVLPVFFGTYGKTNGESLTMTGLAVTDIEIYKDGSATQRASDAGYTLLDTDGIDVDGITGIHGFSIDTGDNTDAGFYTVGSWFHVVVSTVTVDSQTVSFVAAAFRLLPAEAIAGKSKVDVDAWLGTAAATPSVAGVPEVDVTHLLGTAVSTPATAGLLDVNVKELSSDATAANNAEAFFDGTGYAGTNNVIPSVTTVTGNVVGSVGSVAAGGITASSIAADAIGASELAADAVAEIADGVWDEIRLGHTGLGTFGQGVASVQGNVTGSVASVTGNVDGNVTGSVGSVVGAVGSVTGAVGSVTGAVGSVTGSVGSVAAGGITASSIATGAIDADALAADAGTELATAILDLTDGIETSYTLRQALRLILSAAAAKLSGAATTTIAIRDINDTKDRITATVDASGNRTAVTKDVS